jgi:parallel beta-helix repeat protein
MRIYSLRSYKPVLLALVLVLAVGVTSVVILEIAGAPPRTIAPYIERRVSGHNPVIVKAGEWTARSLRSLDRADDPPYLGSPLRIGVPRDTGFRPILAAPGENIISASSTDMAINAIRQANPGDVITLAPGTYRFRGRYINVNRPGTQDRRIVVRAERPGTVTLEYETEEGFLVSAPYWTFEGLAIRGMCREHSSCEHAFHIMGNAHHFIARNNAITDFNSHFKINGAEGKIPDDGIIDGNTLTNASVRETGSPVTPIDLVAANRWVVRRNLISDFVKGKSDQVSFGAFAKGAGSDNRFEQNIVVCEHLLKGAPGQRVGLSLGGGGTAKDYCRDRHCITEQQGGVIESNLIVSCSDDGIYVNRSASSRIVHNTLIDTGGITVRFPESSADIEGNLVDGSIRSRNEGIVRKTDNVEITVAAAYFGFHPVRRLYTDGRELNFAWNSAPPSRIGASGIPLDLCGGSRSQQPAYGAFEQFAGCVLDGATGR